MLLYLRVNCIHDGQHITLGVEHSPLTNINMDTTKTLDSDDVIGSNPHSPRKHATQSLPPRRNPRYYNEMITFQVSKDSCLSNLSE
jgi:hypothetical protein